MEQLENELNPNMSPSELLATASEMLSQFTQMTCLITTPRKNQVNLRQLEFLRLDEHRILVILVLDDREVQNRVIHVEEPFSDNELSQAAALINREFGGRPLMEVRNSVIGSMREDKEQMDALMQRALDVAAQAMPGDDSDGQELLVSGERRLLDFSADTSVVKSLFEAISKKAGTYLARSVP